VDLLPASHPNPSRRFLPAVPHGFVLGSREPIGEGLRRITVEQLDSAVGGLVAGGDVDTAVHEARKSMKRLRAVLRLVRDEIGEDIYRVENDILRDTARVLAPVRDGHVMVETVVGLRDRYGAHLRSTAFSSTIERLEERHRARRAGVLGDVDGLRRVVRTLRSARARYAAWPVDEEIARAYGRTPVRHAFETIAPGLERTYERGRREMRQALSDPTPVHFHLWRKRVKYLRHQMEILEPLWPDVIGGYARSLEHLGDVLGEEHDLSVLLGLLGGSSELCPDPVERSLLTAVAVRRRSDLRLASAALGTRAYAEPAPRLVKRFAVYWEAWDRPPVGRLLET
jgi:CHAD domain-containing protein